MKNETLPQVQELNAKKGKTTAHNNQHSQLIPSYVSKLHTEECYVFLHKLLKYKKNTVVLTG
jgi:hypothetical protein